MCVSPEGELPYSLICNGVQRWGYDMCPSEPFVTETVLEEIRGVANSGCDYMQYFDQNLGGLSYLCYSKEHDHPPGPGRWQTEAMKTLFRKIRQEWKAMGKDIVLGCEAAAAEPFLGELPFNDLRFNIGLFTGEPVPVYQYVYHEYINNFMGNQNSSGQSIDLLKSPDNLLWRTAYSFVAGDMLTVVLGRGGAINWDWGTEWDYPAPDQQAIGTLIRNLNAWRIGAGKPYLATGRMLAPERLTGVSAQTIHMRDGSVLKQPSILTTKWQSSEGRVAQFLVNYTTEPQAYDWQQAVWRGNRRFAGLQAAGWRGARARLANRKRDAPGNDRTVILHHAGLDAADAGGGVSNRKCGGRRRQSSPACLRPL